MDFTKLQFRPGLNRDQTNYSGEGGWFECDKIRFREGFPEKLGGWAKYMLTAFVGTCRQLYNWVTTYSDNLLAVSTNVKFYIENGGVLYDITPLRTTSPTMTTTATDNCINTTNTSTTITVNLGSAHNAVTGQYVTFSGVVGPTIGGIPVAEINANHEITVVDPDTFTFTVTTAATSTVSNQGGVAITISFELAPGYASATAGYGWGVGAWGRGAWGSGTSTPLFLPQRDWFIDNFANDLFFNYRNGAPYVWERGASSVSTALGVRAIRLQTYATAAGYTAAYVPVKVGQLAVSQQDKHLIAFGAVPFGSTSESDFDPLLIRWADQDNPGQWDPSITTNSAGDIRVSRGSAIVRALPTRQEILIWTNSHLYTLQFTGTTDVFALQEYADNISVMSPRAMTTAANITYWMGGKKFYMYTGRVETLNCPLTKHVFGNFNQAQADQVVSGTNERWNEVWWFYPSAAGDWNDSYVVYNYKDQVWYYGTLERTAWLDTPLRSYPFAAATEDGATTGYLYMHEFGLDADGEGMEAFIQSNDFDLDDGYHYMLTQRVIPDVDFTGSSFTEPEPEVTMALRFRNFPGSASSDDSGTVLETSVDTHTNEIFLRARARQMAFKISSENTGVQWQLGSPRVQLRPSGRK